MTDASLFGEFSKVSAKEWKQKIQYDLKGKDYNETLVWESVEGIQVKPFYTDEDVNEGTPFEIAKNHNWQIAQTIYVGDNKQANQKAHRAIESGVERLIFTIVDASVSWEALLSDIDLATTLLHLDFQFLDVAAVKTLLTFVDVKKANIHLNIDPLGHLAKTGNWFHSKEKDHHLLDEIYTLCQNRAEISILSVDASRYQNTGANIVQQLAYALSHANEYLNHLDVTSSAVEKSLSVNFKVAIGGNYFFEIAKLRALRWLWKSLTSEYGIDGACHILAVPSRRNKSVYDYNVNQLRTTTECMAAILGGADTVCNLPYDALYKKDNEFSERLARNQLLVLKNESYFSEVAHAVNGTYYIETLTQQLAEKALLLFKQLEKGGGFLSNLKEGTIQRKTKESAEKEQRLYDSGELPLVGSNVYQNDADKIQHELELYPFVKTEKRKTVIEPIIEKRLAEALEQKRLVQEKTAKSK
ncbi:methylmalonyl-CoA mutase subunit beta [Allomuricauda sp. d1]|uniref:methylmalonyl-CoA mutase subunit beta n=1 Tax=Allomuricauda sp. d1 TaxID=3136725 RepID=UPI0031E326BD